VDIGGVQAGFAAVLARPLGLGSDEADAGAVGVVMYLPGRVEEGIDAGLREEIGRAVGAVEDADFPFVLERWLSTVVAPIGATTVREWCCSAGECLFGLAKSKSKKFLDLTSIACKLP
jgi:hypothetical protein